MTENKNSGHKSGMNGENSPEKKGFLYKMTALWKDIKEAISGTERDLTSTNLGKAILLLAIPMILEMVMESVFAIVDIFFVSKLGPEAVATVGITESLMTIVYSLAIGLSVATTALISRRIGEKDKEKASLTAVQAIITGIAFSFLVSIPGLFFASDILQLMGASQNMVAKFSSYTTIMLGTNVIIMLLFIINAVFRSSGDAAISMRVLWIANLINIGLDPCLIFGWGPFPQLGIKGAAIATCCGRGIAVIFQFYILFKGNKRIRITKKNIGLNISLILKLIKLSLGGIGQYLIATSSWIVMVRIMAVFGSTVIAGYTIALRIFIFFLLPSWGLSNAASTLVGQNLGAKRPDRAERSVWKTGRINMVFMGTISIFLIFFARFFIGLFIQNPEVIASGSECLRILSFGNLAYALGMVLSQAFNGAGDTTTPTLINLFCFWIIEIPLAYILSLIIGLNEKGVYFAILISEIILTILAVIIFRKGKWKQRKV